MELADGGFFVIGHTWAVGDPLQSTTSLLRTDKKGDIVWGKSADAYLGSLTHNLRPINDSIVLIQNQNSVSRFNVNSASFEWLKMNQEPYTYLTDLIEQGGERFVAGWRFSDLVMGKLDESSGSVSVAKKIHQPGRNHLASATMDGNFINLNEFDDLYISKFSFSGSGCSPASAFSFDLKDSTVAVTDKSFVLSSLPANFSSEVFEPETVNFVVLDSCKTTSVENSAMDGSLNLLPNPTSDRVEVLCQNIEAVAVFDSFGRKTRIDLRLEKDSATLDLVRIPSGCYFVHVRAGGKSFSRKLVKVESR